MSGEAFTAFVVCHPARSEGSPASKCERFLAPLGMTTGYSTVGARAGVGLSDAPGSDVLHNRRLATP